MTDLSVPDVQIRAALARVTASEPFRNAPQLVAFLSYVVERTLAGAERDIKGYTIATHALGRSEDFDPQTDPIVRVEAGRLRRALGAYYGGEGQADSLRIVISRGGYVPQFEPAEHQDGPASEAASAARDALPDPAPAEAPPLGPVLRNQSGRSRRWLPAVAVFAFAGLLALLFPDAVSGLMDSALRAARVLVGGDQENLPTGPTIMVMPVDTMGDTPTSFSSNSLRKMVIDALDHFDDLTVIDTPRDPAVGGDDRYVLSLRVATTGTAASVVARLDKGISGKSVWVRSFDPAKRQDQQNAEQPIEASLAQEIATSIGQPYGVIFADLRSQPDLDPRTRCIVKSYDYWINPSAAAHQEIRGCLEDLLAKRPNDATALARLTYMYLDEYRVGYNARPDPLGRARQAARRAVEIAPESPATNQALMAVLFVSGDRGRALALADRLLELNPYDPDLMADVGARFIQIGRYKEGVNLIHRAAALNPACPPWYDFFLFVAAYMQDDLGRASMAASRIGANDFALGFVARAIVAGHKGDHEQARAAIEQLIAIQPEFKRNPAAALARRNFTPEIRERLVRGLENAGLKS